MQLIERTLQLLMVLSKKPNGLSVTELAKELEISASSTHRILSSLKKQHFVLQSSDSKRYRLGYKILTLTTNISIENNFSLAAKPYMVDLAHAIGKTVALCILDGDNIICLDFVESKDASMFMVRSGIAMPPHATSAGKAILAYHNIEQVKEIYLKNQNNQLTKNTKTNWNNFVEELEDVRLLGYAVSDEELQIGVQGIACPIFDYNRKVIASVSFTALKSDQSFTVENIKLLKQCARSISNSVGGI